MVNRIPGTDLDVEVAKRVLGLKVWWDEGKQQWLCCDPRLPDHRVPMPQYSTNTDHSYRLVHHFQEKGLSCHFGSTPIGDTIQWRATVFDRTENNVRYTPSNGDTLAHAICLAALEHLEETNKIIFIENKEDKKTIEFPKRD